jgi:hypothetical protein
MAKKAKSPTGRASKKKSGVKAFDEGKKSAGARKSPYTDKPKKKKKVTPPPGGAAERAAAAIAKGRKRVRDQT